MLLNADDMIHTVKKSLAEYGNELSDEEKAAIETAIKEAEEAIRESDVDVIKAKNEALGTAAQKLGEKVYAKQQAEAAAAGAAAGEGGEASCGNGDCGDQCDPNKKDDKDVVDAEYTEVKDKK